MKASSRGFTLIEVLLVLILLAFLSIATFTSVRSLIQAKGIIDSRTEVLQEGRAAYSILDRDIRMAFFHYTEDLGWNPKSKDAEGNEIQEKPQMPLALSYFRGEQDMLVISSRSHQRMKVNSPESEEHFVTYQIANGDLVRAESTHHLSVEDRQEQDRFKALTLVPNVKSLKFNYYDENREDWVDSWDSERPEFLDRLPLMVKFRLEYIPESTEDNEAAGDRKVEPSIVETIVPITQAFFKRTKLVPDSLATPATKEGEGEKKEKPSEASSGSENPEGNP